jgi:hypothetical protein
MRQVKYWCEEVAHGLSRAIAAIHDRSTYRQGDLLLAGWYMRLAEEAASQIEGLDRATWNRASELCSATWGALREATRD